MTDSASCSLMTFMPSGYNSRNLFAITYSPMYRSQLWGSLCSPGTAVLSRRKLGVLSSNHPPRHRTAARQFPGLLLLRPTYLAGGWRQGARTCARVLREIGPIRSLVCRWIHRHRPSLGRSRPMDRGLGVLSASGAKGASKQPGPLLDGASVPFSWASRRSQEELGKGRFGIALANRDRQAQQQACLGALLAYQHGLGSEAMKRRTQDPGGL